MTLLLPTGPHHYPPSEAERVATLLQAEDPDWTYTVQYPPEDDQGWAHIEVRDEQGQFVGLF